MQLQRGVPLGPIQTFLIISWLGGIHEQLSVISNTERIANIYTHIYIYVYIYMLNKNTPGEKKSEAKSEAPVSSYSHMRLKSVISG